MKKIKSFLLGVVLLSVTLLQSGCFGSFQLTNNLYDWNMGINSDAGKEVIFLAFVIIPVYGVTLFIDAVILNTIEYWSGDSPMSMNEGDMETQIVKNGGNTYQITATKNKFHVEQLDGEKAGQNYDLVYNETEAAWYIEANGVSKKFAAFDLNNKSVDLIKPNGDIVEVDPAVTSRNAAKAAVNLELAPVSE